MCLLCVVLCCNKRNRLNLYTIRTTHTCRILISLFSLFTNPGLSKTCWGCSEESPLGSPVPTCNLNTTPSSTEQF